MVYAPSPAKATTVMLEKFESPKLLVEPQVKMVNLYATSKKSLLKTGKKKQD
jgi:hypothetical protein